MPCWVDLAVADPARARRFYRALFGWEFVELGADYAVATLRGAAVAAIGPWLPGDPGGGAWRTHLAVHDADRVGALVREAGGRLAAEPVETPDLGRAAGAVDPLGAAFGIREGGPNPGAALVNEPGTLTWNEHRSDDPPAAREFYRRVFGYTYAPVPSAPEDYTLIRVDGQPAGAIGGRPEAEGGEAYGSRAYPTGPETAYGPDPYGSGPHGTGPAAYWATTFGAADAERAVERLLGLDGELLAAPRPTPFGTLAVVRDDGGAPFGLIGVPG
ncbi:VOC family protein [Kitasatospora sp. NPDC004240]